VLVVFVVQVHNPPTAAPVVLVRECPQLPTPDKPGEQALMCVDFAFISGWLIPSGMVTGPTCNFSKTAASVVAEVELELATQLF
jgi:hypothetical protein